MAGLEVLYDSAAPTITCAQDALICFLHWEVVTQGYYGLGTGDQVRRGAVHWGGGSGLPRPRSGPAGLLTPLGSGTLSSRPCPEPLPRQLAQHGL